LCRSRCAARYQGSAESGRLVCLAGHAEDAHRREQRARQALRRGADELGGMGALDGKIVLVTGASRGIGRAVAIRLGGEGALVAVHFNRERVAAQQTLSAISAAGGAGFALAIDLAEAYGAEQL